MLKVSRTKKTYPKITVVDKQSHPLITVVSRAKQSVSPQEQRAYDRKFKSINWSKWK